MRLGVAAIGRPTFDMEFAARMIDEAFMIASSIAREVIGSRIPLVDADDVERCLATFRSTDIDAVVILQATFTDATAVIELAESLHTPIVIWSFPEPRIGTRPRLNSLCGANLGAHALRRRGRSFNYLYRRPADPKASTALLAALHAPMPTLEPAPSPTRPSAEEVQKAADVASQLMGRRVGVIGEHPTGFDSCRYDPTAVLELTGISVDRIELADLFEAADEVSRETLVTIRKRVEHDLGALDRLDDLGVERSMRLYGGLRNLADQRMWSGVATRCWPECMMEYKGAACAPQAMLSDDGIPGMCEADVYGALTAVILREIAGTTPFVADLVDVERNHDTAVFWHCGLAGVDLADPLTPRRAIAHPSLGVPVLHEFALRPGRITLARLSQAQNQHALAIGIGEVLSRPRPFSGTSGVVAFDHPVDQLLDTIMGAGLEHHYGFVYGDHRETLRALAELWEIPLIELTEPVATA